MPPYLFVENDHPLEMPTGRIGGSGDSKYARGPFWRGGAIAPSFRHADVLPRITERAVKFLDPQAPTEKRKPFFLYFALTAPHTPYLPADRFVGQSRAGDYGDFVAMVDAAIGEILGSLDRGRLTDETLVIMTSDNGALDAGGNPPVRPSRQFQQSRAKVGRVRGGTPHSLHRALAGQGSSGFDER